MEEIIFEKTHPDAILPERGTKQSSGLDVFAVEDYQILPLEDVLINTGLKVNLVSGYDLSIRNKSGRAIKNKLIHGAEIVDADYTGTIFVHLFNLGKKPVLIKKGEKVAQMIIRPVLYPEAKWGTIDKVTDRGDGAMGSTGLEAK